MNNRPLTYLSEKPDLKALTPSSFLQDLPKNDVPDLDKIDKTNINKRYRSVQRLRQILKERFRIEYLGFLRSSIPKRLDQIKVGDVLIGREDKRRLYWPLEKVIELFPGRDGRTRLVKLKTGKGTLLRPVQRLYPLEVTESTKAMDINLDLKEKYPFEQF
ncbi:bel12-ag transposon polyprotein [Trichonephila clavata]|uniref:Bel12-ag transposon polyprotein n=2 Tax=Trichonephila clavata TaxID=2740835 RepID=A0A8X6IBM2_TRICU|nr:bel12-ag transposon polyprotein [Trichonephila clavata]